VTMVGGKRYGCTIVSLNYLPYAKILAKSFLDCNPSAEFLVLLVDRKVEGLDFRGEGFSHVWVEDLGIKNFPSIAFKFNILELNTNVKPSFIKYIMSEKSAESVIYLDPDIKVYKSVDFIYDHLIRHPIVLTPHALEPIDDERKPSEQEFLAAGVFNLGFIGVANNQAGLGFLNWWERRCLQLGFNEMQTGLFVDQKWTNLIPCLFHDYFILRHRGCNVAYWNLHERSLASENAELMSSGEELVFFHFSGIDLKKLDSISKYQNRYTLDSRPELKLIFSDYAALLLDNGLEKSLDQEYGFSKFHSGEGVSDIVRKVYASNQRVFAAEDPFHDGSEVYKWAKKNSLLINSGCPRVVFSDAKMSRSMIVVGFLLRVIFKLVGEAKYTGLLKYFKYISVLRNQDKVFKI